MTATVPTRFPRRASARLLRSGLVDLLLGPHGVDRYLELISPAATVRDARAEVTAVRRQTARSVTLTLAPNGAWEGFAAGQFLRTGFEFDGVRRTRTYSPAGSAHARAIELTITEHSGGIVSPRLQLGLAPGSIVHLARAQGGFVLPAVSPERLVLISGGSGITPVMSMLRTLVDEEHRGAITFLHYARTSADWLYQPEVRALAARAAGPVQVQYRRTRGCGSQPRLNADVLASVAGDPAQTHVAVCGPASLLDAARAAWASLGGAPERLLAETFIAPPLTLIGETAHGTLRFARSNREVAIGTGTLLEQAEAAGLAPAFGCRMGICKTCTCRKTAGPVRNLRTGAVSVEDDEDIQLCVSAPAGDVALQL